RDTACVIFKGLGVRAPVYGSCLAIWEFGWHVLGPVVDRPGNGRPHCRRRQPTFLPDVSGALSARLGSGLAGLRNVSLGNTRRGVAIRVQMVSRIRADRLFSRYGVVRGCGAFVRASAVCLYFFFSSRRRHTSWKTATSPPPIR